MTRKYSFRQALVKILVYTLLISGTTALSLLFYFHHRELRLQDPHYAVQKIEQIGDEQLDGRYLAEWLELSTDKLINLYELNIEKANERLLASPVIRSAEISKTKPDTISIQYSVRRPVAYFADFTNLAIDTEGFPFPVMPFFASTLLPEIYFGGVKELPSFNKPLPREKIELAFKLLELLSTLSLHSDAVLKKIDLSRAFLPSFGRQEIIITLEHKTINKQLYLRLNPENFIEQLPHYPKLIEMLFSEKNPSIVIDLRIPCLAFFCNCS